ncbi:MAG TPA: capsid cement protein [Verrucomicrobiae bacterium]|nr:capsid cement protein [Verrucomicrobiae bacterium]
MNLIGILIVMAVAALLAFCLIEGGAIGKSRKVRLANIGEARYPNGIINLKSDAAITERYRIVKRGSDADHFAITAAIGDVPLGICLDEPAAAEVHTSIQLLGACKDTVLMRAAAAIAQDAFLEATANGRVQTLTTSAGTHHCVGRALRAAAAAGDLVEVDPTLQRIVSP